MKKIPLWVISLTLITFSLCFGVVEKPNLPDGTWWNIVESYDVVIDAEGATGNLSMQSSARYNYVGIEDVVQTCEGGTTISCYHIHFNGGFGAEGEIHYESINGNIRVLDGTWEGDVWLAVDTYATVKKHRYVAGEIEMELAPDYWAKIADLVADQFEDYCPPIQDVSFPLDVGMDWSQQGVNVRLYGIYSLEPLQPEEAFDESEVWDLTMNCDAIEMRGGCSAYHIAQDIIGTQSTAQLDFWFCPAMLYHVVQEVTNMSFGGVGQITFGSLTVTDYNVPAQPPTATPTPTQEAPTATPTPTQEGPTATPTATPTGPTPTPTTPGEGAPPKILLAGYWDTYISSASGGNMTLLAFITDPDGDPITRVDVCVDGSPTGLEMFDDGTHGDFGVGDSIYGITLPIPAGAAPPMNVPLEIQATDSTGAQSDLWPYLNVKAAAAQSRKPSEMMLASAHNIDWAKLQLLTVLNGVDPQSKGPNGPFIALGGYWQTDLKVGVPGDLNLMVYVMPHPAGINSVELFFGGTPAGLQLLDNGASGDFGPGDGIYGLLVPGVTVNTPLQVILEVMAMGNDDESDLWPYLNIN